MGSKIEELVDRAVSLDRRIKKAQARLEGLKEELRVAAALDEQGKKRPAAQMAGKTVDLAGRHGNVAEVYFPERGLIRTGFWLQGDDAWTYRDNKRVCLGNVIKLAGDKFGILFRKLFKPQGKLEEFKQSCEALLTPPRARDLVAMFEEEQTARVSFKSK